MAQAVTRPGYAPPDRNGRPDRSREARVDEILRTVRGRLLDALADHSVNGMTFKYLFSRGGVRDEEIELEVRYTFRPKQGDNT